MRYCHQCKKLTHGEPLFCNHCGSSFNDKLCPSRHVNSRYATACRECGSREFSTPAPPLSLLARAALFVGSLLPGVLIAALLLMVAVAFIQAVLTNSQVQSSLIVLLVILAILFYAYMHLPGFLKGLIKSAFRSKHSKDKDKHH
jgi:RNA polymerase subunit RPABC4/transcription elongation factor Spt4